MTREAQINVYSLAAHRLAIQRLREQPQRLDEALKVLSRWRQQTGGPAHFAPCRDGWARLLNEPVDAVELAVCNASDHADVLRSRSPLGRFISPTERQQFLNDARQSA